MARNELDREDLLREATALVERAELEVAGCAEPLVVGFRRDGAASLFFGADPVYQFNAAGELRRAYRSATLYKAEAGRLVAMRRERKATETCLLRSELSEQAAAAILADMAGHLASLEQSLDNRTFRLVGQVPPAVDVVARFRQWLAALPRPVAIAQRPNVR